jgi:selenide,water dikinase
MQAHPRPRSGVYAVRAGPVLADNLRRALAGQPLRVYVPQRRALYLLATGPRHAVASWGPLTLAGDWVWRWKDRIDRRFIARHTVGG